MSIVMGLVLTILIWRAVFALRRKNGENSAVFGGFE
jgi:hypothetical protein